MTGVALSATEASSLAAAPIEARDCTGRISSYTTLLRLQLPHFSLRPLEVSQSRWLLCIQLPVGKLVLTGCAEPISPAQQSNKNPEADYLQLAMATLGATFSIPFAMSGGKKTGAKNTPPINAGSKDEEKFIQYNP